MTWTPLHGATFGPLTTSTLLSHSCAERQTCEWNHFPPLQRTIGCCQPSPAQMCPASNTHKAVTGFLSATASPRLSPTVYRCSSCAQVPLAGTLGLVPNPKEVGLQAQSWQWKLTELMTDFLPGRVIGKHKTLTVPGFSHGVLPCSFRSVASPRGFHATGDRCFMILLLLLALRQKLCQRDKLKDQK